MWHNYDRFKANNIIVARYVLTKIHSEMGQQQSGFGGKREDRGGGDADKVFRFFYLNAIHQEKDYSFD